jgi:hypothetical protein
LLVSVQKKREPVEGTYGIIICRDGTEILVNPEDYFNLRAFKWTMKRSFSRSYAGRWSTKHGKRIFIYMHRAIMRCPSHLVVHHIDNNQLNNMRENLMLLTPYEHKEYFSYR